MTKSIHGLTLSFLTLDITERVKHVPLFKIHSASQRYNCFKEILQDSLKLKLGQGNILRFWVDCWIGDIALKIMYPRLYRVTTQSLYTTIDVGLWDGEDWCWDSNGEESSMIGRSRWLMG